tara:strand:+ start:330 stop:875 length:546 start_codon:yes stop_codon:yes gene_type:complete
MRYDVLTSYINYFDLRVGVELGVSAGENFFALLRKNPNLFLYGVDTWVLQEDNVLEDYDASDEMNLDKRKQIVDAKLLRYQNRCKIFEERTDEAYKHFEDDSLDFVFIDADHSYESVKKDIELWSPKVRTTGFIFGHDINWGDVARAVGECFNQWFFNPDNVWSATRHHHKSSLKKDKQKR